MPAAKRAVFLRAKDMCDSLKKSDETFLKFFLVCLFVLFSQLESLLE